MSSRDLTNSIAIPWIPGSEILIRPMSIKNERMLLAYSDDMKAYNELIKELITPVQNFDYSMIDRATRDFLLSRIRVITYGDSIMYNATCPKCGRENKNYKASLLFPNLEPTLDDMIYELSERSNLGVRKVRLQDVTVDKLAEMESILKQFRETSNEDEEKTNRMLQALSLELLAYGLFRDYSLSEVKDFAESGRLSLYDLKMIIQKAEKIKYGMDTRFTFKCRDKDCLHEWTAELPVLSAGFLVPCEG